MVLYNYREGDIMELNNKSIIITDKAYFKKVFLYRNKYAKSDIKIYTE